MLPPVNLIDTTRGRYLLFASSDMISLKLYLEKQWEPLTLAIAKTLLTCSEANDGAVVDVGANLGAFTIPLARELPAGLTFHCFEIQRLIYYQLCGNALVNGLQNVYTHHVALGEESGVVRFPVPNYAQDSNAGGVSISPQVRQLRRLWQTDTEGSAFEDVELRRLDDFDFVKTRLIKIDVEGTELQVLRGARRTLESNDYPPILFELWDESNLPAFASQNEAVIAYLAALGYNVQRFGELGIAQRTDRPYAAIDFDAASGRLNVRWMVPRT